MSTRPLSSPGACAPPPAPPAAPPAAAGGAGPSLLGLSVFPGIDGLGLAFLDEWPELCLVRGPDVIFGSEHDVRRFHPPAGRFFLLLGGPPCQEFSPLSRLVRAQGRQPRFGNLIPEFERCVAEAQPDCWVMEQVPQAPEPRVPGYTARHYLLNNRWFPDPAHPQAVGAEQRRVRRISFGTRDGRPLPLDVAALEAPLTVVTVHGHDRTPSERDATRAVTAARGGRRHLAIAQQAVLGNRRAVPVKRGGSGKVKSTYFAHAGAGDGSGVREGQSQVRARAAVAAGDGSDGGASVRMARYTVEEACVLQGFPPDFLKESPFTQDGRLRAVANAVPRPLGRAIARAVRRALGLPVLPGPDGTD